MDKCSDFNDKFQEELKLMENVREKQKIWNDEANHIQVQLKELEGVEPQLITKLLEYKQETEERENQESRDVAINFKRQIMDPKRKVIQWERDLTQK